MDEKEFQLAQLVIEGRLNEALDFRKTTWLGGDAFVMNLLETMSLNDTQLAHVKTYASHPEVETNHYFSFLNNMGYKLRERANETHNIDGLVSYYKARTCAEEDIAKCSLQLERQLFLSFIQGLVARDVVSVPFINELSVRNYDMELYDALQNTFQSLHKEVPPLPNDLFKKLQVLKACPESIQRLRPIINQLMPWFYMKSTSEESAGPYLLAAIRQDKKERYDFLPTLLFVDLNNGNVDEFKAYLNTVSKLPRPVKERFLLADGHWQSGEIQIDEDGRVKLFVSDSEAEDKEYAQVYCEFQFNLLGLKNLFPEQDIELYFLCGNDRQHTGGTCSTFALDDVRHFYTMDQYGPKESLFRQLDARKMGETQTADGVVMHLCRTPPTLHRTFQSRRVVETIPEEDKERIINKRQQTVLGSIMTHFSHDESGELKHNERLAVKAMHMREQLDRFFIEQLEQDPVGGYDRIKALANEHKITAISDKLSAYNHEERFVNPYP